MNQPTTPNTVEDFLPLPKPKFWSKDHPFEDLFTADQVRAAILADRAQYAKGVKSGMDFLIAEIERLTGLVAQRPTVAGSVDTPEFQKRFTYMLREEYAELVAYIDSRRTADTPLAAGDRTKTLQFLTDVVTAAGLLSCGKTDKGLAKRISADAYDLRAALFATSTPAAPVVAEGWKFPTFEDWLASPIESPSSPHGLSIQYAKLAFNAGRAAHPVAGSPAIEDATDDPRLQRVSFTSDGAYSTYVMELAQRWSAYTLKKEAGSPAEAEMIPQDVWQERVACARLADAFAYEEGPGERRYSGNVISARILARTNKPVETVEPMARFCPGCGSVGGVDVKYRDCCPDGGKARLIPEALAEQCHDLFSAALAHLATPAAAEPMPAATLEMIAAADEFFSPKPMPSSEAQPVMYQNRLIAPNGNPGRWVECDFERYELFANRDVGDGFKYEVRALYTATPVPASEAPYPYDALFRAIGDATKIEGKALAISVKQFVETLASKGYAVAPVPASEAARPKLEHDINVETLEYAMKSGAEYLRTQILEWHYANLAAPAAPTDAKQDQIRRALQTAMDICDAVPTRLHNSDDETFAHIGRLVNAQPDGSHGYAVIRDALASYSRQADIPQGAALGANGVTYHGIEEIYHRMEEGAALHMWLDDEQVPRADNAEKVYSLVGRVQQYSAAQSVRDALPEQSIINCEQDRAGNLRVTAFIAVDDVARLQDDPVARTILQRGADTASDWCLLMESVFHSRALIQSPQDGGDK